MHMCMCEIPYGLERTIPYECEGNQMRACRAPLVIEVCEGGVLQLEVAVFRLLLAAWSLCCSDTPCDTTHCVCETLHTLSVTAPP
mmetsp:Transcript_79057/g.128135  ORF Transcript_79057/g.128135 Transcript_79057/m.128135 type:complete len:85 (+) Transcript_79057:355-609(+)